MQHVWSWKIRLLNTVIIAQSSLVTSSEMTETGVGERECNKALEH